jgi:hypothetical protein
MGVSETGNIDMKNAFAIAAQIPTIREMKTLIKSMHVTLLLVAFIPVTMTTGCSTPPNERVQVVQTLKGLGLARESAMRVAGQLYADGKMTEARKNEIIAFHDDVFQPAYRLAVAGVQGDIALASPDLLSLFQQLQTLINK